MLDGLPGIGAINRKLQGEPNAVLTVFLIALALFGLGVALFAPPVVKAAVIAYWIFP